jgi:arylsulfatase
LDLQPEDPTIADVLKPLGYVSGQFGKNHLGDRDEFLPTAHGFDEFSATCITSTPSRSQRIRTIRMIPSSRRSTAARRAALLGKRRRHTEDREHGPLTVKRMETVDEEFLDASVKYIDSGHKDGSRFFCWWNLDAHAHLITHLKKESEVVTGPRVSDGMVEHTATSDNMFKKLDETSASPTTRS